MKTSENLLRISDNDKEIVLDPSNYSFINISRGERILSAVAGIALTACGALLTRNTRRHPKEENWYKLAVLPVGMYLVKRGLTGYCALNNVIGRNTAEQADLEPLELSARVKVDAPRKKVYKSWKDLGHLSSVFPHIEKVEVTDDTHSSWTAGINNFMKLRWEAEMTESIPDERISWRSLEGSDIGNSGDVIFTDAEGGGTDVEVTIHYIPPAGRLGKNVAAFFSPAFRKRLDKELDAFAGSKVASTSRRAAPKAPVNEEA